MRSPLPALLLLTLLVRGSALLGGWNGLRDDPDGYRALARNVVRHGTLGSGERPTAYRPPLYPLLLAPLVAGGGDDRLPVALLQLALGMGTVAITLALGRRWGLSERTAVLAGALVAVDPILLRQSTLVMTETLAALLAVAALWALTWAAAAAEKGAHAGRIHRTVLAGALMGLASLCRPTFLPWTVACILAWPWLRGRGAGRRWWETAGLLLGAALVLSPWVVRNTAVFHRPLAGTTHGGYTFYLANNADFYAHLHTQPPGTVWDSARFDAAWWARSRGLDELSANRLAYRLAWRDAAREPALFVRATLLRLTWLWGLLPHRLEHHEPLGTRLARFAVAGFYLAEFILAVAGVGPLSRFGRRGGGEGGFLPSPACGRRGGGEGGLPALSISRIGFTAALLLLLSFTATHAFYWTNLRMRGPLMPVVALAAAAGAYALARRRLPAGLHPPS